MENFYHNLIMIAKKELTLNRVNLTRPTKISPDVKLMGLIEEGGRRVKPKYTDIQAPTAPSQIVALRIQENEPREGVDEFHLRFIERDFYSLAFLTIDWTAPSIWRAWALSGLIRNASFK